jgi:ABC-type transporter MlaC component
MLSIILYFIDSTAYTKLSSAMLKESLTKGIKQASPLDQTSFLEGFHSVVNQFSPKMNAYSFSGQFCRYNVLRNVI